MTYEEIITELKSQRNETNIAGMARFGIGGNNVLGISIPVLRKMAKKIGTDHDLALKLWKSGIHEARILAGYIDDPILVTEVQMEEWVKDFDSWDVCDQISTGIFDQTQFNWKKALEWSKREEEFVKRAGFALMAGIAVHDKKAEDTEFIKFLDAIKREAGDERNFVKKAVNWALRNIGKRNKNLCQIALKYSEEISKLNSKSAKWIAKDATRELKSRKWKV